MLYQISLLHLISALQFLEATQTSDEMVQIEIASFEF